MAFSESFGFGSSTFENLESQVKRAIEGKEEKREKRAENGNDIIAESPTGQSEKSVTRTRSRFLQTSRNETQKKPWRRSLSDSKLLSNKPVSPAPKLDHFTQFFESDFAFSVHDEKDEEKENESLMRVSRIEAALEASEEALTSAFDVPISSEDVRSLLETDADAEKENSFNAVMETERFEFQNGSLNPTEAEEFPLLDETSFICPERKGEFVADLKSTLERSKRTAESVALLSVPSKRPASNRSPQQQLERSLDTSASTSKNAPTPNKDLESLKHISAWGLPPSILREYEKKGIMKMFDWQIECLSNPKLLFEHCNLVYSAPTSAGKTLVSEILLLKTVLERSKKVLMILPFISVVREKMFYLQDLLTPAGYRVEGFFGGYTPPGGFESINVAICTIEKANSIVNKLLEQSRLETIGAVVVDEIHLISDPGRGYILELLLAKILFMSRKYGLQIQIITMSATLANVELLKRWLDAELYITNYRPVALNEMIKIGTKIYDSNMKFLRDIRVPTGAEAEEEGFPPLPNDADNVAQLCLETILEGCSVIVFCPSKDWCEKLAIQLASVIHGLGKGDSNVGQRLRKQLKREAIDEMKQQLRDIPTGLDSVLEKTIHFGCAFHHAGLTTEERDIVEASFKSGALKIIVATSTLSSGVNLPARRVIIRTPLFGGKPMSSLTYKQMIGRAGRTGKDTLGESILICNESNARSGRELISAELKPITSCLELDSSTHLKRALLEVISSGVAVGKSEIADFVNCTLLSAQKRCEVQEKDCSLQEEDFISEALQFLIEFEFVRRQTNEETHEEQYIATRLGLACLASSMPPTDGLLLFSELQKCRRCVVLESELHAVYLVTPYSVCYQIQELDWLFFLDLWEKLSPAMKKVGELVGVKESFLVRAMRGQTKLDYKLMQIHKRFYTALALQELVNETPINVVAKKYKCPRGLLQSLQQMASTFAGIVTAFCTALQWDTLSLIVSQFKDRLFFGIHRDLIDLMRLPDLSHKRARALFDAGVTTLVELAHADVLAIEKVLHNSFSFDTAKRNENENSFEAEQRNLARNFFITGKADLTVAEAARLLVEEARRFVAYEIGVGNIKWTQDAAAEESVVAKRAPLMLHMSCEEENREETHLEIQSKKRKSKSDLGITPPKLNKDDTQRIRESGRGDEKEKKEKTKVNSKINIELRNSKEMPMNSKNPAREKPERKSSATDSLKGTEPSSSSSSSSIDKLKGRSIKRNAFEVNKDVHKANENNEQPSNQNATFTRDYSTLKTRSTSSSAANVSSKPTPPPPPPNTQRKSSQNPIKSKTSQLKTPPPPPRRSPRNRANKILTVSTAAEAAAAADDVQDIFANEESFEMNSGFTAALNEIEGLKTEKENISPQLGDEIPGSQTLAESGNESPNMPDIATPRQTSRYLRSFRTQRYHRQDPSSSGGKNNFQATGNSIRVVPTTKSPTQSASDISLESSLSSLSSSSALSSSSLPFLQMNASHILSCSKVDNISTSFKSIDIVDICGDGVLFESAFDELLAAKRFGCCLGVQRLASKQQPLIGANLLINQVGMHERRSAEEMKEVLFQIEDNSFLSGIAFSITQNIVYFMNLQKHESKKKSVTTELKVKKLCEIFGNSELTLVIYDARRQLKLLRKAVTDLTDIQVQLEDPKVANWLLQPDRKMNLKQLAQQYAPECSALVDLCGGGRGYKSYGIDESSAICAKLRCSVEACVAVHILQGQMENLDRIGSGELSKFFRELEMPLQLSLCNMELTGFPVYEPALRELFQKMLDAMKKLEIKIFALHGKRFNLSSASAVGKVLGLHKKPNGRVCTTRQVLEKIDEPIAQLIIAYRKLSATVSKNIQPLLQMVQNDRIHGHSDSFTATGRISMKEPNLQNVAKEFEVDYGNEKCVISCRKAFFPKDPTRCLISADFCQLEMRILAHLAKDPHLLRMMRGDEDIFTSIAAGWNRIEKSEVSEKLRNGTKQICYGIVYGMGIRALAEALKCSEQEAKNVSEQFHEAYPTIRIFTNRIIGFARRTGYVETIQGRRRYLEHIKSEESALRSQAERQAVNSAIQGSAADIAKKAILRTEKSIIKYRSKLGLTPHDVQFVLHLHDELIYEVPTAKARKIAKVISLTMEACTKLDVPLRVKLKMGRNWGEMSEVRF